MPVRKNSQCKKKPNERASRRKYRRPSYLGTPRVKIATCTSSIYPRVHQVGYKFLRSYARRITSAISRATSERLERATNLSRWTYKSDLRFKEWNEVQGPCDAARIACTADTSLLRSNRVPASISPDEKSLAKKFRGKKNRSFNSTRTRLMAWNAIRIDFFRGIFILFSRSAGLTPFTRLI